MAIANSLNTGADITLGGTLTTAGAFTLSGAFPAIFNITSSTNVTFPTSGTLATVTGTVSSITGTANEISASASTGAITLSIPSTFIAPGTIAAVTSISSPDYLLTGSSSGTISILPQAAAGTYNFNLPITAGTSGYVLTSAGGSTSPMTWTNLSSATVTSIAGTANEITASASSGAVTLSTPSTFIAPGSIAATTTVSGTTFNSSSLTASQIVLTDASKNLISSGTLSATLGGSGVSSPTAHGVLISEGSSAFTPIVLGAGQILIGTTSSDPAAAAIGSGTGILVGNSSGAITISNTGVTAIAGTSDQINSSASTGSVTLSLSSTTVFPGTVTLNADPSAPLQAATKQYVDAVSAGIDLKDACYAATTPGGGDLGATYNNGVSGVGATLTAGSNVVFTLDGTTPALTSRILVKNQTNTYQNGIYTVTAVGVAGVSPWILTRSLDYDLPAQIMPGDLIPVINGTINTTSSWLETATVTAIGSGNPITFIQFTFGTAVTSITGTANQITASSPSGAVTLSTPSIFTAPGTINSTGLLSGLAGVTITGAASNIGADARDDAINIGTAASSGRTITIGNTTGTSGILQYVGNGNFAVDGVGSSVYAIGPSTTTGSTIIGGSAQTGTITLGSSSGTNTVAIGAGAGATTINIGGGSGSAKTINIGAGSSNNAITIGNGAGTTSIAISAGSGNVAITGVTTISTLSNNSVVITGGSKNLISSSGALSGALGGTGVANTGKAITLGGNLTTSGAFDVTLTLTASTNVTLPTSGTLATTAGASIPSISQGDILYGSASNTLSTLAKNASASTYLSNTGTSNNPAWAQVNLANGVSGTLPVANGGTGGTLPVANGGTGVTTAFQFAYYVNASTQSIPNASNTNINFPTTVTNTFGSNLTYSSGTFTNGSGGTLNLLVSYSFRMTSSATSGEVGGWVQTSNTTYYLAQSAAATGSTITASSNGCAIIQLPNSGTFNITCFQSNSSSAAQNLGGNNSYLGTSVTIYQLP